MAATDSYRLSYKETPIAGSVPELEAIVPARALEEVRRLADAGGSIELGVLENQVLFGIDGTWLTSRRIEGQFPKFDELRPKEFKYEVALPREELLDVVRRTSVMAHRNSPLRLRFAEGEVTVWTQTQDVGEARESLPIRFEGEPLEMGFNADFLRDGIESAEGDEMRLRLIDPLRPGLIQGPNDDFWYLIMPIRLAG
jgi:DNA polymerase-3 subunit beta